MFFLVCDGLKGLPDVVVNVWPQTIVQTCLIHLIRNTFRLASKRDWDALKRDLRLVYTAVNATAARVAFDDLAEKWGARYPLIVRLWNNAWAGSSGALPRRSPLRTGRASRPRIRLKQAQTPRKQRHTVKRIYDRLMAERGMRGVYYQVVRAYAAASKPKIRAEGGDPVNVFFPQTHRAPPRRLTPPPTRRSDPEPLASRMRTAEA